MRCRIPILVIILTALLCTRTRSVAQPFDTTGRWIVIQAIEPAIGTLPDSGMRAKGIYFATQDNGYWISDYHYRTSDGGESWSRIPIAYWPFRLYSDGFCMALNGQTSVDFGATWDTIHLPFADTTGSDEAPLMSAALTRDRWGVLYGDPSGGPVQRGVRLAWTTDRGRTWTRPDSLKDRIKEIVALRLSGGLPSIPDVADREFHWQFVWECPDTATLLVGMYTQAFAGSTLVTRVYVGRINLETSSVSWTPLPWDEDRIDVGHLDRSAFPFTSRFFAGGHVTALGLRREEIRRYRDDIWRTTDGGVTWDSVGRIPPGIAATAVLVLDSARIICDGWRTYDGGRTWSCWRSPFYGRQFQAIDSTTYVVAGDGSFFARSDDMGRRWRTNVVGSTATAAAAANGYVWLADDQGRYVVSSDSGITWRDRTSAVPDNVIHLQGITVASADAPPLDLFAVGLMQPYSCDSASNVLLRSTDAGMSWSVVRSIPVLKGDGRNVSLRFLNDPGTGRCHLLLDGPVGRFISIDSGMTWKQLALADTVPANPTLIDAQYWAGYIQRTADTGTVMVTTDAGTTWRSTALLAYPNELKNAPDNLVAPAPGVLLMFAKARLTRGRYEVLSSLDTGMHWITRGDTSHEILKSYIWLNSNVAYGVNDTALFLSRHAGLSFIRLVDSIPTVAMGRELFLRDTSFLYLPGKGGVMGRWRLGGELVTNAIGINSSGSDKSLSITLCNGPVLEIQASLNRTCSDATMEVSIVDMLGNTVAVERFYLNQSDHRWLLPLPGRLPTGVYVVSVKVCDSFSALSIVVSAE